MCPTWPTNEALLVYFSYQSLMYKLLFATALAACAIGCKPAAVMTETEKKTMNDLTQNMQTHCVGRYLIDIPREFKVVTDQAVGYKRNVVISSLGKMSKEQFDQRMAQIQAEYAVKKHKEGWKYLRQATQLSDEITLFHKMESDRNYTEDARVIEGYRWSKGLVVGMVAKATDADMEKPEDSAMTRDLGHDVPQKIALLTQMLIKVQGREMNEIPKEPGFCFEGGFLPGRAGDGKELEIDEEFRADFFSKQSPDISFDFSMSTSFTQKNTLLQNEDLDKLLTVKNAKVLRKGQVSLAGIPQSEEWLVYGDTDDGNLINGKQPRGHYFKLQSNSKISNPLTPRIDFVMRTGQPVRADENAMSTTSDSSLSELQALALWDTISKTIRLR
jgi:hypothetical protein